MKKILKLLKPIFLLSLLSLSIFSCGFAFADLVNQELGLEVPEPSFYNEISFCEGTEGYWESDDFYGIEFTFEGRIGNWGFNLAHDILQISISGVPDQDINEFTFYCFDAVEGIYFGERILAEHLYHGQEFSNTILFTFPENIGNLSNENYKFGLRYPKASNPNYWTINKTKLSFSKISTGFVILKPDELNPNFERVLRCSSFLNNVYYTVNDYNYIQIKLSFNSPQQINNLNLALTYDQGNNWTTFCEGTISSVPEGDNSFSLLLPISNDSDTNFEINDCRLSLCFSPEDNPTITDNDILQDIYISLDPKTTTSTCAYSIENNVMTIFGTGAVDNSLWSGYSGGGYTLFSSVSDFSNVTSLVFQEGITEISDYAFYYCDNVTSITFPSTLTSIGSYGFNNHNCSNITIPSNVTHIDSWALEPRDSNTNCTITLGWNNSEALFRTISSYAFGSTIYDSNISGYTCTDATVKYKDGEIWKTYE